MLLMRSRCGIEWPSVPQATTDVAAVAALVAAAIRTGALAQIVGQRGVGKTTAIRAALRGSDALAIEPLRLDRERLHIGDVVSAVVTALGYERPRHSAEARSAQARRLLGRADRPVAIVIDDAHLLATPTVRALRRLREWAWQGRAPLAAIVLVGQSDRTASIPEVGLRTSTEHLAGLTAAEAQSALEAAGVPGAAAAAMAAHPRSRCWLDLQALMDECLLAAAAAGEQALTPSVVERVVGGSGVRRPPSIDASIDRLERSA